MRIFNIGIVCTAAILAGAYALPSPLMADDVDDCNKATGNTKIEGCSRIIKSGRLSGKPIGNKTLAIVHNLRGIAYGRKGDSSRADADIAKAIQLNPKLKKQ